MSFMYRNIGIILVLSVLIASMLFLDEILVPFVVYSLLRIFTTDGLIITIILKS